MSEYKRCVVGLIAGLLIQAGHANPLSLTLYLDITARQFLNASNQSIVIVVPDPASEADNSIVAVTLPPPIADTMTITIELNSSVYVANTPPMPMEVVNPALTSPVIYGNAYSFNGYAINGNGKGKDGTVGIYYDAPANAQALITGQALFIYDSATGKPSRPSPINAFTLNRFQSRYIPQPAAVIWAMVGSNLRSGSVLPNSVLKSVTPYLSFANASAQGRASFQISRYLEVPFNGQGQASIHYDSSLNAFQHGPYPK